jgi:hypothetical protein
VLVFIDRQLARRQRTHGFTALTLVEHQTPFHRAGFGVNGGDGAVSGVAKPQRLRGRLIVAPNGFRSL